MYNREYFPPPPPEEVLHEENYFPPPGPGGILTRREGVAQGDMEDQVPHPYRFSDLMRAGGITIRLLAIAPPRRSPFAPHILAKAIQPGVKLPSLSEYNRASDPQDHLDRFLARADLLDINDVAYCKLLQTTLSGKIMAWFNQLPPGTIEAFEQLSHHFPHHFAINKLYPKTASYLFTIIQKENESLREYVQRFSKAVLEEDQLVEIQCGQEKATIREVSNATDHVAFSEVMAVQHESFENEITFNKQDLEGHLPTNNDAIVIAATISNFWVKKILIDSGSSVDILFYRAFSQMGINNARLTSVNTSLTSFSRDIVEPLGEIMLPVSLGSCPRKVLADPNISRRMVKWSMELSKYGTEYRSRPKIKAQPLVDFISEMTGDENSKRNKWWKVFVDGLSTSQCSGAGIIIETPQGDKLQYTVKFNFAASNNEAEYKALLEGGRLALVAGTKHLKAQSDS
ncbi:UNVERIFIED_CONTAM: hypothetical protein Scaly_1002300 [Sesamum calycinum]|uniref:Retrotransposon gag domain-containing protein n=1 Tax=Sesamum calycinum TaxID=2727403 RepID=A0AAW2QZF2_9LAMI